MSGKKGNCLMARIDEFHTEESSSSSSTFDANLFQAARDPKKQDWDSSSMYQVNKFVNYSSNEKVDIF